ncbi:MAG: aminopeptidase P N-terminal domain-containing protein [Sulfuricurvum sp.]|uniref:aminopeptidase P N-terminal domain-containing protein n=2 Tax=Sulfuricurvum sp. TaxID=2025608 RepID=UPI00260EB79F|nr:aminopeptidase P N-terminal domain-containing protein [Sulfuricurvum sp.]MDD2828507.1 aminopeptidase P N-terminal domain-containing protein [Sulfuricurvum sp.]
MTRKIWHNIAMNETHFLNRRSKLLDMMEEGLAIITSAPPQTRSNDTEYPYRQNSDFYYLCGFNEDNSVLVLIKTPNSSKTILFVEAHNAEHALWNGARMGIDGAREKFSVDEVHDIAQFGGMIKELLHEHINLYIDLYSDSSRLSEAKTAAQSLHSTRGVKRHIRSIRDVTYLIRTLRLIKSSEEIESIKKAIAITAEAHHSAMEKCRAGMREYQLQAEMNYIFLNNGASSEAYGAIVAGGNNANTLHYVDNRDELRDGDLVLIDAACEWELYASDITRTFPINGKFSDAQREVYNAVLDVQLRVIEAIRVGVKRDWLQNYSEELLCDALIELGILSGERKTLMEAKEHKKYAPHGIGHWMGLDVHDPCPYVDEEGESLAFMAGMVMTIEPGLYFRVDDESVPERYRGIGIRIEDNILVTEEGYENLSVMIAKSVEEIEGMCRR